jgi:monomeric phenylalanine-4-hydroxylase
MDPDAALNRETDFARLPAMGGEVFTAPLQRPGHVGDDWLEPAQRSYGTDEHAIWDDLFARQMELLPGRACDAFLAGLDKLRLSNGGVPDFRDLSERLGALTGWSVVAVPMLIPDHVFFWHLANRRFPAGNFIRTRETFDYIQEPDVFHDVFGHVPMLTDAVFADYMQEYGRAGWKAMRHNRLKALGALYWYTVEFGLIRQQDGLRIYGAGILSGPTEAVFAQPDNARRRPGDAHRLRDRRPPADLRGDRELRGLVPPHGRARFRRALRAAAGGLHLRQHRGARQRRGAPARHPGILPARRPRLGRPAGLSAYLKVSQATAPAPTTIRYHANGPNPWRLM